MNCTFIIREALRLGILCRPYNMTFWRGMALKPEPEGFFLWSENGPQPYRLTPEDLLSDWELVTKEILDREIQRANQNPF